MAVHITTNPTSGGTAPVNAGNMKVEVEIDAAATVSTWMVPHGLTAPITPGQGHPQPPPLQFVPYTFPATVGNKYDVTVQANNSQGLVTVTITVAT